MLSWLVCCDMTGMFLDMFWNSSTIYLVFVLGLGGVGGLYGFSLTYRFLFWVPVVDLAFYLYSFLSAFANAASFRYLSIISSASYDELLS